MPRLCAFAQETSLPRAIRDRSRWLVHNAGRRLRIEAHGDSHRFDQGDFGRAEFRVAVSKDLLKSSPQVGQNSAVFPSVS